MFRVAAGAGLTATLGLVAAAALAGPAAAAPGAETGGLPNTSQQCAPTPKYKAQSGVPWAQQALGYSRAWKYTEGQGVKVAVIDSGVDSNPQFGNRVQAGKTFAKSQSGPADSDCVGHGTMVAGIIGAGPASGTQFEGVAPRASILSFKVSDSENQSIPTTVLAQAIGQAINDGARVINVSIATTGDDSSLRGVINFALQHNIVVVAAAGNDQNGQKGPFFPASYPGVLSVGAVDSTGALASFSDRHSDAGVTAPGADVTSTFPGSTGDSYGANDGTSFAAPFVSGLAALIIAHDPGLTAEQVVQRIEDTADGSIGTGSGNGLINPVQALTATTPADGSAPRGARPGAVTIDRTAPNLSQKVVALSLAGGALLIAVIVIAAAVIIPAGRRRGWRPGES